MAKKINNVQAVNSALHEEMARDSNIFIMGEDVGPFGGAFNMDVGLYEKYPERIIDTPISEASVANVAIGAAVAGKRPIFEMSFADFLGYACAPICLDMTTLHYVSGGAATVPMVVNSPQGGFINSGCHHSNCVEGWVNNFPGLTVIAPTTPYDMKGLLKASIRSNNPILFMPHKLLYARKGEVPEEDYVVPIGKADVVQEGTDITIVCWQLMRQFVEKALKDFENEGISVELIDPRTIKPFDYETLYASVKKTGRLLIVHEHVKYGGVGEAIAANVMKDCWNELKMPVEVMGREDRPIPAGYEEKYIYPSVETITAKVIEMVKK